MKRAFLVATFLISLACTRNVGSTADVAATTSTGASDIAVTVTFEGLITHFRDKYQRAVVVYAPSHPHRVRLPKTTDIETIVKGNLGGSCPSFCRFTLKYMSMQLLDASKKPLSGNMTATDGTFDRLVPKLKDLDPVEFDDAKLHSEAVGAVTANSKISWGYFDLRGGDASATPMPCQGKFDPNVAKPFFEFAEMVTVQYTLPGGGYLRVTDSGGTKYDIPLVGSSVTIEVDNAMQSSMSHLKEFEKLSTGTAKLPQILFDKDGTCKGQLEAGGIPGCSDTQWP